MLAIIAAVVFFIAFLIGATGTATTAIFAPASLALIGFTLVALYLAGIGPAWSASWYRGRTERRARR